MDPTTLIIFILAFASMVIIHEFGHYIAAILCGIEVEEFAIGLPTPGSITYWIKQGWLLLQDGRRIEIPRNFKITSNWNNLVNGEATFSVDQIDDRLVLRSVEATVTEQYSGAKAQLKGGKQIGIQRFNAAVAEVHPGTRFTIYWLPLGGFVRPKGENDPDIKGGLAAAKPWKRLIVLLAGPFMNLLAAVLIYSFIVMRMGAYDVNKVLISSVSPDSPAQKAGLLAGDIFVTANGVTINNFDDLSGIVSANSDKPVDFVVDRNGQTVALTATPHMNTEAGRPMIGVGLSMPHLAITSSSEALRWGAQYTSSNIRALISLPARYFRGQLSSDQSRLVGLKGIYDIMQYSVEQGKEASQTAPASQPFDWYLPTLEIVASLSISLGVFNLFPFPALDGGRIIFVLPEMIFRRRVPHQFENLVHGLGMTVLLLLMIYINVMDFIKPINLP